MNILTWPDVHLLRRERQTRMMGGFGKGGRVEKQESKKKMKTYRYNDD